MIKLTNLDEYIKKQKHINEISNCLWCFDKIQIKKKETIFNL